MKGAPAWPRLGADTLPRRRPGTKGMFDGPATVGEITGSAGAPKPVGRVYPRFADSGAGRYLAVMSCRGIFATFVVRPLGGGLPFPLDLDGTADLVVALRSARPVVLARVVRGTRPAFSFSPVFLVFRLDLVLCSFAVSHWSLETLRVRGIAIGVKGGSPVGGLEMQFDSCGICAGVDENKKAI